MRLEKGAICWEATSVLRIYAILIVLSLRSLSIAGELGGIPPSYSAIYRQDQVSSNQTETLSSNIGAKADLRPLPPVDAVDLVAYQSEAGSACADCSWFDVGYDDGIFIDVCDEKDRSFRFKVNGRIQFRYTGFSRDVTAYTDNAGVTVPVRNRSQFDIERARLIFSGHAFDENSTYFIQLDGDTDRSSSVIFFDYWWAYQFNDQLEIKTGKAKVPGSRQWLLSAFDTRLADRPLATDFFRPDRTQGIWAEGKLGELTHYQAMVGNGFNTATLSPQQINDKFVFAGSVYADPLGDYGTSIIDFENHEYAVARVGSSFVYSQQSGVNNSGNPIPESGFARLSDGTVLTSTGALTPGVTVDAYNAMLVSIDGAAKYRGWSFDAEYYFRQIDGLRADGVLPVNNLFQHGFYFEGGFFVVPQTLDLNARYSQVTGEFGTSTEYAAGFSFFPYRSLDSKMTFDVTLLDGSPTSVMGSNIRAGDDGLLFRAQYQALF